MLLRRFDQYRAYFRTIGLRNVDVSDWGIIVVGKLPKFSEIDEIVGHNKVSDFETSIYGANSVRSYDTLNSKPV